VVSHNYLGLATLWYWYRFPAVAVDSDPISSDARGALTSQIKHGRVSKFTV
jgi:hypothetical protein